MLHSKIHISIQEPRTKRNQYSVKKTQKPEVLTRPAKIRQNRDPTRSDPTRGSIRPVDNFALTGQVSERISSVGLWKLDSSHNHTYLTAVGLLQRSAVWIVCGVPR